MGYNRIHSCDNIKHRIPENLQYNILLDNAIHDMVLLWNGIAVAQRGGT